MSALGSVEHTHSQTGSEASTPVCCSAEKPGGGRAPDIDPNPTHYGMPTLGKTALGPPIFTEVALQLGLSLDAPHAGEEPALPVAEPAPALSPINWFDDNAVANTAIGAYQDPAVQAYFDTQADAAAAEQQA